MKPGNEARFVQVAARAAWSLWTAALLLSLFVVTVVIWTRGAKVPPNAQFRGIDVLFALSFATVGAVVASRRPTNPVGWLFCGIGTTLALQAAGWEYAGLALIGRPGLPLGEVAAWVTSWLWLPAFNPIITVLLLLFPHGRLLSPPWRLVLVGAAAGTLASAAGFATTAGRIEPWSVANPFAVERALSGMLILAGNVVFLASAVASVCSLIVRFRRARLDERKQIEWLLYAAAFLVAAIVYSTATDANAGRDAGDVAGSVLVIIGLVGLPVACGAAILRYRLYDIDRVISRTVSYAIVTLLLGGTFALLVLLPPVLLGGDQAPDYVIAVATLVVAALFRPLRRRVQNAVDHRFNRKRYDAEHTIEAFTARLREHVDIDALGAELEQVVKRTMQPARVSLWVRERAR